MSIRVDNTAHVFPGVFCWLCLAGIFLATGEWTDSLEKAQQYPVLLTLLALLTLVSSGLLVQGSEHWAKFYVPCLLATVLSTGFIVFVVLGIAEVRVVEFTLLRRRFGLGRALIVGLPLLFVLYMVIGTLVAAGLAVATSRRDRREKASLDGAITAARETVRLKPEDAQVRLELAQALLRKRDATRPGEPMGYMGPIYLGTRKDLLDTATTELREAVRLAPHHPEARGQLGDLLRMQGNVDGAIVELQKATQLKPDHVEAHVSLAMSLADKGDWSSAIPEYREAIRLQAGMPQVHVHLAKALEQLGDHRSALEELGKARELEPSNGSISYEYERLQRIITPQ